MKKKPEILQPDELDAVIELFNEKKWSIDEDNKSSLFNRFLRKYLGLGSASEKEMFLALARDYKYVSLNEYMEILLDIIESTFKDSCREDILVMPLVSEVDSKKIKSGTFVSYLFSSVKFQYKDNLVKKNITIVDNYEMLQLKIKKDKILILVDDYIGSGQQFSIAYKDFLRVIDSNQNVKFSDIKKIYVLSLFINNKGKKKVHSIIKDHSNVELIYGQETNTKVLEHYEILSKLYNEEERSLGYNDCGELITLVRTPNNTIPLFSRKKAPFPRV